MDPEVKVAEAVKGREPLTYSPEALYCALDPGYNSSKAVKGLEPVKAEPVEGPEPLTIWPDALQSEPHPEPTLPEPPVQETVDPKPQVLTLDLVTAPPSPFIPATDDYYYPANRLLVPRTPTTLAGSPRSEEELSYVSPAIAKIYAREVQDLLDGVSAKLEYLERCWPGWQEGKPYSRVGHLCRPIKARNFKQRPRPGQSAGPDGAGPSGTRGEGESNKYFL